MKLDRLLRIGIVVNDAEAAVKEYEKFGIGPWKTINFTSGLIPGMTINGVPGSYELKIATCSYKNFEVELLEPLSESIFMNFLREHGPGVHHMEFAPGEDYTAFMEDFAKEGNKTTMEVLDGSGKRGFAYLDTYKQLGFFTEIHKD